MTDNADEITGENKNPSEKTRQQITEGVEFVYDWLSERYEAGKLSNVEYKQSVEKLRNMKVFTTSNYSDRLISALESGEVHINKDLIEAGYTVDKVKDILLESPKKDTSMGFSVRFLEEPAAFINIDKINERADVGKIPGVSSIVAHEVTHVLDLEVSEYVIDEALCEKYGKPNQFPKRSPEKAVIKPQVIGDNDITYEHGNLKATSKVLPGVVLNEGVVYNSYADSGKEVYARIMQMRYDMKLDPKKTYTPEDVEQLRKQVMEKRLQEHKAGEEYGKDYHIFNRYSNEQISHFLNDTAQVEQAKNTEDNYLTDIKQSMSQDGKRAVTIIYSLNNQQNEVALNQQKTVGKKQTNNNYDAFIWSNTQNTYG